MIRQTSVARVPDAAALACFPISEGPATEVANSHLIVNVIVMDGNARAVFAQFGAYRCAVRVRNMNDRIIYTDGRKHEYRITFELLIGVIVTAYRARHHTRWRR